MGLVLSTVSALLLVYGGSFGTELLFDRCATPEGRAEAGELATPPAEPMSEQGAEEARQ